MAALTIWLQKYIMYSWWQSNVSLAASCEHAFYKCAGKRRWFAGLEGKWLWVTDERAKATSLKSAPVYINIYLVRMCASMSAVKTPESILCVFVCVHVAVRTLNATIQASELLIQTTVEQKSINNTRICSKKLGSFTSKSVKEMRGEGATRLDPSQGGTFLALGKRIHTYNILGSHLRKSDNTLEKCWSLQLNLIVPVVAEKSGCLQSSCLQGPSQPKGPSGNSVKMCAHFFFFSNEKLFPDSLCNAHKSGMSQREKQARE